MTDAYGIAAHTRTMTLTLMWFVVAVLWLWKKRSGQEAAVSPSKCHQLPSVWGKLYLICLDVRSLLCVYMQNMCLCAGGRMYVKVHEDCGLHVPMNLHNKRHNIYQTPWTPRLLRFLPAGGTWSSLESLRRHRKPTWTLETIIDILFVVLFSWLMRKYYMKLLPILKDQRLLLKKKYTCAQRIESFGWGTTNLFIFGVYLGVEGELCETNWWRFSANPTWSCFAFWLLDSGAPSWFDERCWRTWHCDMKAEKKHSQGKADQVIQWG